MLEQVTRASMAEPAGEAVGAEFEPRALGDLGGQLHSERVGEPPDLFGLRHARDELAVAQERCVVCDQIGEKMCGHE